MQRTQNDWRQPSQHPQFIPMPSCNNNNKKKLLKTLLPHMATVMSSPCKTFYSIMHTIILRNMIVFRLWLRHFSFKSLTFQASPSPPFFPHNAILCSIKTIKLWECHETTFNIYGRCTIKLSYKCHNDDVNCKFIFCNLCPHLGPFNWQSPGLLPNMVGKMIYANGNAQSYCSLQDR